MTPIQPAQNQRSYGCTLGCGNAYDFVLVDVRSGDTEMLCTPCYIRLASDMVEAITNPEDPNVAAALAAVGVAAGEQAPGPTPRRGRRNAPVTSDDSDLFDAFDGRLDADELPEEFR